MMTLMIQLPLEGPYNGYFTDVKVDDNFTRLVRSGVRASAGSTYASFENSDTYQNGTGSLNYAEAPEPVYPTIFDCPEYAAAREEIGDATLYGGPGVVPVIPESGGWYDLSRYGELTVPGFFVLLSRYYYNADTGKAYSLTGVDFNYTESPEYGEKRFEFTSYYHGNGEPVPPGYFLYAMGYQDSKAFGAGYFSGSISTTNDGSNNTGWTEIPATGGWSGGRTESPVYTQAWLIAESPQVPAHLSVLPASIEELNIAEAFAGNFSSWPDANMEGTPTMTGLSTPTSGGGGGGGE